MTADTLSEAKDPPRLRGASPEKDLFSSSAIGSSQGYCLMGTFYDAARGKGSLKPEELVPRDPPPHRNHLDTSLWCQDPKATTAAEPRVSKEGAHPDKRPVGQQEGLPCLYCVLTSRSHAWPRPNPSRPGPNWFLQGSSRYTKENSPRQNLKTNGEAGVSCPTLARMSESATYVSGLLVSEGEKQMPEK